MMKAFASAIFKIVLAMAIGSMAHAQTASILPNAKTTFFDQNGNPLSSGKVYFYEPGTTTPKQTWQDIGKTTPNAQPVPLDAAGRAIIWGDGQYRQQVYDKFNNLIWDQNTASASAGNGGATIGDGMAVGFIAPYSAITAPPNYQFAYGQALSRASYPELFAALTFTSAIGCTGGNPTINITDTTNISVGTVLESICVSGSPTVVSKTATTVTLSSNSTVTVGTTGRFFFYGNGDALTTFNVPDLRGYVPAGRCNMGGVTCSILNSTYFSSNANNTPSSLNAKGGNQSNTIVTANLPPYTPSGSVASSSITRISTFTVPGGAGSDLLNISGGSQLFYNFTGNPQGGTSTPYSLLQPTLTLNYIIKVTPDTNLTSSYGVAAIGGMTGIIACGTGVTCAGNTITFNFNGVNSIQGMTGNITCGSGITCSGNTITASNNNIIESRSAATFLNLSSFNVVETLGYAKGGDGGGAKFYRNNGAILTFHITNAGSCTNGTWPGIKLNGGTGKGATGTLITSGGVATNFSLHGLGAQGTGYAVNDVLTVSNAGNVACTTYPTITVDTVGNAPFIDATVATFAVTNAGSGCTNGSYQGIAMQNTVVNGGGFGYGFIVNVTIGGGAVTGVSQAANGGGYRAGDQLSFVYPNGNTLVPGCVTQPIITINSVTTPVGSFTDSSGTNFQIINDMNTNVLQFGAKADFSWLILDADATDNGPAFRAGLNFVAVGNGAADAKGYDGGKLFVPKGGYLVCNGLTQYQYTTFYGAGWGATTLKQCNSDGVTVPLITQGSLGAVGEFAINTWDMTVYGAATGTGPVIYSNNNQSGDAISRVAIYPNATSRTCIKYEIGYGGQSMYGIHNVLCVPVQGSPAIDLSGGFGFQIDGQTMIASAGTVARGIRIGDGGVAKVDTGVHCEGSVTNCVSINGSGSSPPMVTINGLLGPATTNLVFIETGTPTGFLTLINSRASGSPCTVFIQATATCAKTGNQLGLATYP